MMVEYEAETRIIAALQAIDRKLDGSVADARRAVHAMNLRQMDERLEQERRNSAFLTGADAKAAFEANSSQIARIEKQIERLTDRAAEKDHLAVFGNRVDALTQRIDLLTEQIAATAPRLGIAEAAISELRAGAVPRTEAVGMERRIHELAARLDLFDQGHTNRVAGLSTQITTWLVSLLLVVAGAVLTYALSGR